MSKSHTHLVRIFGEGPRSRMRSIVRQGQLYFMGDDDCIHPPTALADDSSLESAWKAWEELQGTGPGLATPPPLDVASVLAARDMRVRSNNTARALSFHCARLARLFPGVMFTAYAYPTKAGRGGANFFSAPIVVSCEIGANTDLVAPLFRNGPL